MRSTNNDEHIQSRSRVVMLGHVVVALTLLTCSSKRGQSVALSTDLAAASIEIKAAAANGCDGFARAIESLSRTTFRGRVLIGLVDEAIAAARPKCPALSSAITGAGRAQQLAAARLADDRPADALRLLADEREPAVRLRRAELLDRLGRAPDALRELDAALAADPDDETRATHRLLSVGAAAHAVRLDEVASLIGNAPLPERTSLAFRAATDVPSTALDAFARTTAPELATAIADRIERERGPAAALEARARAAAAAPELAEAWDALARSQIAAGKTPDALASWDRAIDIAPAQSAFRVTPIRALVLAGESAMAKQRAAELAKVARARDDIELLVTASAGAAAAGDRQLAVEVARAAHTKRPGDGRLVFGLAQRLAEAGERVSAATLYAELLACGAHGRPWHRHEVSAKLVELADRATILAALDAKRACAVADPADLATYVDAIRGRL